MMRHFALNIACAALIWAWGLATGRLLSEVLPAIRAER